MKTNCSNCLANRTFWGKLLYFCTNTEINMHIRTISLLLYFLHFSLWFFYSVGLAFNQRLFDLLVFEEVSVCSWEQTKSNSICFLLFPFSFSHSLGINLYHNWGS